MESDKETVRRAVAGCSYAYGALQIMFMIMINVKKPVV